jgi:plastocyanin
MRMRASALVPLGRRRHMDDRRPSITRIGSGIVAIVLFAVACGGPQPATTTGSPEVPAPTGVPSPIDGLFFSGHSVLRVDTGRWTLQGQTLLLDGLIEVDEGRLVLSKESSCAEAGTYAWTLAGEALTLQAEEDPCPGRNVILDGSWESIEPLGGDTKTGEYVAFPDLHFAFYRGELDVSAEQSAEIDVTISEAGGWFFSPTVLTGSPGQQLELKVRNPKGADIVLFLHNFSLPDQDIDVDIEPGEQTTVNVVFPASGSLTFFCRYHAEHGQAGLLTVAS